MRQRLCAVGLLLLLLCVCAAASAEKELTVLFTSDIHSYFTVSESEIDGTLREHGGAGRLQTLVAQNSSDHSILVDAGDFAMGTVLQYGFSSDAYELRLLGRVGCDATTFGNHEFDQGSTGAASMLRAAVASGERLPQMIIPANLDLSGTLTEAQQDLADALAECGAARYMIREVDGIRVAVFGMMGKDAVSCAPTSGVTWQDPITAAKAVVKEIGDQADVIICISHSGTKGDGKSGEDIDLIKQVPEIDVVISGHTHTTYEQAVVVRDHSVLGSCGSFLSYLGRIDLTVSDDGTVDCTGYQLIPCDENVEGDVDTDMVVQGYLTEIDDRYLSEYDCLAEQVIAHSDFTLYAGEQKDFGREEQPLGNLIADSYLYACRQEGLTDVEVAIVGQGTIRTSLMAGDISVADAFEVCSLGVGADGSTGHPLVSAYVYGSELKLIAEMEAFIGPFYGAVRMSYSGLRVTYDANRVPLDRVTELSLVRADGTTEPVQMDRLYHVVANMYAVNMIGSIAKMSYGLISLNPKDAQGQTIVSDAYYDHAIHTADGRELKEWAAFAGYLSSFEKQDGISQIPESYSGPDGRKTVLYGSGLALLANPGPATLAVLGVALALIVLIVALIATHKRRRLRRQARRAARKAKKSLNS